LEEVHVRGGWLAKAMYLQDLTVPRDTSKAKIITNPYTPN